MTYEIEFEKAMMFVTKWEGIYSFDKDDPGGETKYGISKRAFPSVNIKALTYDQAKELMFVNYWLKGKCNNVQPKLKTAYFDSCVNIGITNSGKILQRTINSFKKAKLEVDGLFGEKSLKALGDCNNQEIPYRFILFRIQFYQTIIKVRPKSIKYIKGWLRRSFDLINQI